VKAFVKQGLDLDRNSVCMPSNLIEAATEVQRYKINNRYLAYLNFVRCLVIFVLKQGAAAPCYPALILRGPQKIQYYPVYTNEKRVLRE